MTEVGPQLEVVAGTRELREGPQPVRSGGAVLTTLAKASAIGLFVIAASTVLKLAAELLIPITFAIVIGLLLGPGIARLERRGVPAAVGALIAVVAIGLVLYLAAYAFSLPLQSWIDRAPELWRALQVKLIEFRATFLHLREVSESIERVTSMGGDETPRVVLQNTGLISTAAQSAPAFLGQIALFVCVLFFFLATRSGIRQGLLNICFGRKARLTAGRVMRDVEARVSDYLLTITVINLCLGAAVTALMWALGLPSPTLWGALAFVLNYAPFLGPAVLTLILAGVSLVTFKTTLFALAPPICFVALTFLEGNIITPTVLGRRFTINPLLVLLALAFWLWLWGPVGAFLAVPLLVIALVLVKHLLLPHIASAEEAEERKLRRYRIVRDGRAAPLRPRMRSRPLI